MGVPTWHEAIDFRAFQVGRATVEWRVVGTGAEAALPTLQAVADAVAREDFPAFIAEAGVRGEWVLVGVRTAQRVKGVFIGEDTPE